MQRSSAKPEDPRRALVVGAGPVGLMTALVLAKRNWNVRIVDEKAGEPESFDLPYVCSQKVEDFLHSELPSVLRSLESSGARKISIAEILRSRFSDVSVTERDERTKFLCLSRSVLQRTLLDAIKVENIDLTRSRVERLRQSNGVVDGLVVSEHGATASLEADLVIDTSGGGRARTKWVEGESFETFGPAYTSLARFYTFEGPRERIQFNLARGQEFRGGIYPLEGQRFAIALIVPDSVSIGDPEAFFARALEKIPGSEPLLRSAKAQGSLQRLDGIRNRASDFYEKRSSEFIGFLPLGDSILSGNPIYGRGLSLATIQLKALAHALDAAKVFDRQSLDRHVASGVRQSRKFWIDGAMADRGEESSSRMTGRALQLLREVFVTTVIPQLATSPALTRRFLYNYQLMLPAWRITGPREYWTALTKLGEMRK